MSLTNIKVVYIEKRQGPQDFQEIWDKLEPGEFLEMGFEPGDEGLYIKVDDYRYLGIF